ncbi:2,4-dihydroxyhept-2-enedioate aldolase [Micromonospora sp. Llam0]|nr:2,4-dihydroxyhept-2-enedioate aldolase [Micromonospora sp. Llam0]
MQDTLGCFCALGSPLVTELVARSGAFGWLCVDLQHGMGGFTDCLAGLQAVAAIGIPALVRIPVGDDALVTRVLDAGAHGVLIANVETPEQARRASAAAFYPPRGARSIGPTRARYLRDGYVAAAAAHTECIVMLESPPAFEALDDIAREPVTGLFVGLADLVLTLGGHLDNPLHDPLVRRWLESTLTACAARGLTSGVFSEDVGTAVELKRMGFDRVAIGLDATILMNGARKQRAAFDTAWSAA